MHLNVTTLRHNQCVLLLAVFIVKKFSEISAVSQLRRHMHKSRVAHVRLYTYSTYTYIFSDKT